MLVLRLNYVLVLATGVSLSTDWLHGEKPEGSGLFWLLQQTLRACISEFFFLQAVLLSVTDPLLLSVLIRVQ